MTESMNIIIISNSEDNKETKKERSRVHQRAFKRIGLGGYGGFCHEIGKNN